MQNPKQKFAACAPTWLLLYVRSAQVNVLALIEEVRSDEYENDGDGDGNGMHLGRGGSGGGGGRGPANDDTTNATPPSSKLLSRGGGGSGGRGSASRYNKNKAAAAAGTRSDADLLEDALAYSRAGAPPPPSPSWLSVPAVGARGSSTRPSLPGGRGGGGTAVETRRGAGAGAGGGQEEKSEIRATAAALLRRLIVEKQDRLRAHFHKIPFMPELPDLPALGEVGTVLAGELGYQSLAEQLGRLAPLLKDESTEVWRGGKGAGAQVDGRDRRLSYFLSPQMTDWLPCGVFVFECVGSWYLRVRV